MNNCVILVGRICRNIELRKTQSGMSVCNVTLAIPRNYKNNEGVYETDFLTCVCYKYIADKVAEYCQKGDLIGIKGMIQSRTYEKDDKKVYTTEIIAEKVSFLSSKSKEINEEIKKEQPTNEFEKQINEFSNEADLSDLEITQESLPF